MARRLLVLTPNTSFLLVQCVTGQPILIVQINQESATVCRGRPVSEESVSLSVSKTVTVPLVTSAVTASGARASASAQRTVNASTKCVTHQQALTLHVNTVMLTRTLVSLAVPMTASVHPNSQSVDMAEDLICVAAALTRIAVLTNCATQIHMNASQSRLLVVITTMPIVHLKSVTSLGLTITANGVMIPSANLDALMTANVLKTNQSVALAVNPTDVDAMLTPTARLATSVATMNASLLSALTMLTVRMESVMSTTLLTI